MKALLASASGVFQLLFQLAISVKAKKIPSLWIEKKRLQRTFPNMKLFYFKPGPLVCGGCHSVYWATFVSQILI